MNISSISINGQLYDIKDKNVQVVKFNNGGGNRN